jgi:hypothetical protein
MQHLRAFALSEGNRYQALVPDADRVVPNKLGPADGNRGWSFCAHTPDRELFMLFFEACAPGFAARPRATVRGALPDRSYSASWFDPRSGDWIAAGTLQADARCNVACPDFPSDRDWALKLVLVPQTDE